MSKEKSIYQKIADFDRKYQILWIVFILLFIFICIGNGARRNTVQDSKFQVGKVFFENYNDNLLIKYNNTPGTRYILFYKNGKHIWSENCLAHYLENSVCKVKDSTVVDFNYMKITSKVDKSVYRYTFLYGTYKEGGKTIVIPIDEKQAKEWFYEDPHHSRLLFFCLFMCIFFILIGLLLISFRIKSNRKV